MAKKRVNQGRRVVSPLQSSDAEYTGPTTDQMKDELEFYGRKRAQLVDISAQMENIFTLQQDQTREADRQFGIEKQLLNNLGVYENKVKLVALQKKLVRDLSLEDSNIIKQTVSDYEEYNREAAGVARKTQELLRFRKEQLPFEDKIKGFQSEIAALQAEGVKNLSETNKLKLKDLETLNRQYQALSKQEQMNQRIEKIQENISGLMFDQGTAAGQILSTMKDIITNPLVIFTGLLALGVQRYEEMRQRANQLVEEQDRVNKALAGAGPFQDKILEKARRIQSTFRAAGEGFASSLEGAAGAVTALEAQLGNVDFISNQLVDTMTKLKLSIGLSDEESAKVLDNFMIMSNLSEDAAVNASNLTYQLSESVGLNPQAVFQDIASASAETLANFSGGAHEIAKAAVSARRMGITLKDVANISKSLLDIETSIEAEMEAQMLTGLDLNFNRARMFAMNKQGDKAAEEVLRQVGGLARFQKMNIFQQEAIAKATGLDLDTLLKSNAQRERENKLARDKNKLVGSQLEMSVEVTRMMGKLDVGLTIMQRIAKTLGDIFLDVFMPGMKKGEDVLLQFIEGDKFKTVVTTILKGVKSVMDGIVSIFRYIGNSTPFKALSNYFGGGNLSASNPGQMDDELGASRIANAVKVGFGAYALFKLGTFLNPMVVTIKGGAGPGGTLGNMFGLSGSPGQFYKGGQFMPGGGRAMAGGQFAAGRKFLGMNLGRALGGASGATGTALGGTALGTAGAVLGGLGVVGSIGKGIYDVATLSDRATRRERATAYGGLAGAAGGAATGALIGSAVPVVGTLLGAGIGGILGYFGGRAIGSMDDFRDELDTARDAAREASEAREEVLTNAQKRFELEAMKGSMQVGRAFKNLSGGMKELTGKRMKEFGDLLVEQGVLGRDAFKQFAKDGKITMEELQKIQSSVSDNIIALGNQQINEVITKVDENVEYETLPVQEKVVEILESLLTQNLGKQLDPFLSLTEFRKTSVHDPGYNVTRANIEEDELRRFIVAQTGITDLTQTELAAMFDAYNMAMEIFEEDQTKLVMNPEDLNKGLTAAITVLLNKREADFLTLSSQRDNDIVDEIDNLNNNGSGIDLSTESIDGIGVIVNKNTTDLIDNNNKNLLLDGQFRQQLLENLNPGDKFGAPSGGGGYFADGGILYGPRHSQGGIPTQYGELEGGEAVINRKSTRMFAGLLSQINQAGGGHAFALGGILGLGPHTAHQKMGKGIDYTNLNPAAGITFSKYGDSGFRDLSQGNTYGDTRTFPASFPNVAFMGTNFAGTLDQATSNRSVSSPSYNISGAKGISEGMIPTMGYSGPGSEGPIKMSLGSPFFKNLQSKIVQILYGDMSGGMPLTGLDHSRINDIINNEYPMTHNNSLKPVAQQMAMRYLMPGSDILSGKGGMHGLDVRKDQGVSKISKDRMYPALPTPGSPASQEVKLMKALAGNLTVGGTGKNLNNKRAEAEEAQFFKDMGHMFLTALGFVPIIGPAADLLNAAWYLAEGNYLNASVAAMSALPGGVWGGVFKQAGFFDDAAGMALKTGANRKAVQYAAKGIDKFIQQTPNALHGIEIVNLAKYGYKGFKYRTSDGREWLTKEAIHGPQGVRMNDPYVKEVLKYKDGKYHNDKMARGGILPNSPITKVNDMILTAEGKMIETHPDDNIIAKKGGITQKTGGGGPSRVEQLLEGILHAIQEGGDTYIDGAKVSAAINSVNHNV